ncbi:MAG: protein kinase [Acidobacteria bacterium]|nr:protein kinase [Acidobacteriota bacterium]MBV9478491.1 protein kinase [Acidobacteriota bacterium]
MADLGSYRLIARLGTGGMGDVWRAEDKKLLRAVAIKILPAELAADPEWKERFLREARTVAQLNHPNIATIYAIEEEGETLFIAMELVEGESVGAMIARGPLLPEDAIRVGVHVADGLSEAHAKGIIHRDIKPDNIIIAPRHVKILDFGVAKQVGGTADPSLTQGGMVVGTPHYMSPEQALGRTLDARTDIFSLGVVLYEMLSGQKPFTGEALTEILLKIVMNEPRDIAIAAAGIPSQLAAIVRRCMKKEPQDRFASCEELRAALAAVREDPRRARQSSVPTIAVRKSDSYDEPPRAQQPSQSSSPATPSGATPAPDPRRTPLPSSTPVPRAAIRRALVADDDPATRFLLRGVLQRYEYDVDEATNGADAVKLLKQNQYGYIFLDLLMPRVDGWGVLDFLRTRPTGRPQRIYIVTGVKNQKLSVADEDVVSGLLYKPLDIGELERLMQRTA